MNVSLVLIKADGSEKEIPLRAGKTIVGRDNDAQIRIPSANVSRRHCEFEVRGGDVILRDQGSSNGTFVNAEKVDERALRPGDAIAIDEFVFVVRIDGRPVAIDASFRDRALPKKSADDSEFDLTPAKRPALAPDPEDSSVGGFNFDDLLDDDDDQPKL